MWRRDAAEVTAEEPVVVAVEGDHFGGAANGRSRA